MEKGYYHTTNPYKGVWLNKSQSTIKMEKGYYLSGNYELLRVALSQSTIKMEKGYY